MVKFDRTDIHKENDSTEHCGLLFLLMRGSLFHFFSSAGIFCLAYGKPHFQHYQFTLDLGSLGLHQKQITDLFVCELSQTVPYTTNTAKPEQLTKCLY